MLDIIVPLWASRTPRTYHTIFFAAKCFLAKTCSKEQMVDTRPTVHFGVPLVWDGIKAKLQQEAPDWVPGWVIKGRLGLNECKYAASGAGAISPETIKYFQDLGINILN